jgi:hypothetical protein
VLVPTRAAAEQLRRTLEVRLLDAGRPALALPVLGPRADLYDLLHERLPAAPRRLSAFEREVMLSACARDADQSGTPAPFTLRPGLVAEVLQLYDALRRQLRTVHRFEEYLSEELERDVDIDRGAVRMLQQTRFLAYRLSRLRAARARERRRGRARAARRAHHRKSAATAAPI